jgi:hypothetical protein
MKNVLKHALEKKQFTSYTPNCQPSSTSSVADSRHLPLLYPTEYCIIYHHNATALHHGYWLSMVLVLNPFAPRYSDTGISQWGHVLVWADLASWKYCWLFFLEKNTAGWLADLADNLKRTGWFLHNDLCYDLNGRTCCGERVSHFNCRRIWDILGCCSVWLNFFF